MKLMNSCEPVIRSKKQMYDMLAKGLLGNTILQYFSIKEWRDSGEDKKYAFWGVRTLTPGGPCRLNCPVEQVEDTIKRFESDGNRCNISLMIDKVCNVTLWAELWQSPTGLVVYGIEYPVGSWREKMPYQGKHWDRLSAKLLLEKHLNGNSLTDAMELLEKYPGHILELSATESILGIYPGRNTIHWELRAY